MTNVILENDLVESLTSRFRRSPDELNRSQESDAEIVRLPGGVRLAVTTDSIAEEIASGLYKDPFLAGWMSVIVNMSDLAAVGATPAGILISEVLPSAYSDDSLALLQSGIRDACASCGTYVLGGDTNRGDQLTLTGTAIGVVHDAHTLTRVGCRPGDILYTTGPLGVGNAFALAAFVENKGSRIDFQPHARLREGRSLVGIASACMDTSDGVLSTLDQLMRLNNVGFEINAGWEDSLDRQSKNLALPFGIPLWLLLAGQHGEFELTFTVPANREHLLIETAEKNGWKPMRLGKVVDNPHIAIPMYNRIAEIDTGRVRNLAFQFDGGVEGYIEGLLTLDHEIQKGV